MQEVFAIPRGAPRTASPCLFGQFSSSSGGVSVQKGLSAGTRGRTIWLAIWVSLFAFVVGHTALAANKPPKQKKDPSDALFATNAPILTFSIQVSSNELAALQKAERSYVRSTITVGANVFHDVGVHLKGNGSFRPLNDKPSFVAKFDRYVPDQKFFGETKIALNNSSQDGTYLAEFMGNAVFRDADVPASRITHARVKFNGRDLGLYVLVEMHNKEFLKRWFGNGGGSLYEAYLADIDSQMDQDNGDDKSQNDRKRFAEVLKIPDPAQRWAKLREVMDVDRYVSHLVCEVFTSHTDGYAMNRNNYRIYHHPNTEKFTFIGHGVDWAFQNTGLSIKPPENALVTKALLSVPEGRALFKERFGTLFTNIFQLEVMTNRVNTAVARLIAHTQNTNEVKDFLRYGAEMNARIIGRRQSITNKLYAPPPVQLAFDSTGVARLRGWTSFTRKNAGPALYERGLDGSKRVLRIGAANGPTIASWRTRVALEQGNYVFEGDVRGLGILAHTNQSDFNLGAGLRISGPPARTNDFILGNTPWSHLHFEFTANGEDVELVCELQAKGGDAWFDEDSLRIARKK
ncbi:MAG TPA: CotH kinase family protein [Methylomirabilota bacterium]|nr:CotH kinase family protein [Methylomirabilota bacterium]